MRVVGVDPGKSGGLAVVSPTAAVAFPMPIVPATSKKGRDEYDIAGLRRELAGLQRSVEGLHVVIENLRPFPMTFAKKRQPGQEGAPEVSHGGTIANWNRGNSVGLFVGLCAGLGIPYTLVVPQAWQRAMLEGTSPAASTKQRSILAAQRLFPTVSLVPPRCRKPHDGLADALLIAEWGRRMLAGDQGHQRGLLDVAEARP